jgi:hypothetical protein
VLYTIGKIFSRVIKKIPQKKLKKNINVQSFGTTRVLIFELPLESPREK